MNDPFIEYVNMCETAIEVQNLWKPIIGDKFVKKEEPRDYKVFTAINTSTMNDIVKEGLIWLPYQEELQNILRKHYQSNILMTEEFLNFLYEVENLEIETMSINQLYLLFTMKIITGKTWKDGKWAN